MIRSIFISAITGLSFSEKVFQPSECPGLYCGRQDLGDGLYSECGACPRGSQPSSLTICAECTSSPSSYDWLYLGFMALLSFILHLFFIDYTCSWKKSLLVLHLSALAESVIAVLLTLILSKPLGSLQITSCPVERLEDWYTMLYNPSPNYTTTLHCTQEIVYPLYTIVMIYYAFSLLLLMCIRPVISMKFVECKGTSSIYAALYFLPILIVLQAVFGGLLYYSFPYIVIIASLVTSAVHMASGTKEGFKELVKESFCTERSLCILIGHWFLHAYGIVSLTEIREPALHLPLLLLVFFPVIFYICTVKFTDPDNLDKTE